MSDAAEAVGFRVDAGGAAVVVGAEARKRQIVAESYQPGFRYRSWRAGMTWNANLVFNWRRQYRELARVVGGFVPVVVSSTEEADVLGSPPEQRLAEPQPGSAPLVQAFGDWPKQPRDRVSPKS